MRQMNKDKFSVSLYSRGDKIAHGLIRACYDVHADDDVDAAMRAKEEARRQWPHRGQAPWFADRVEMINKAMA
jgi:hypothetical protein